MFLSRPLIALLEHLGVKHQSFMDLQQEAIFQVNKCCATLLGGAALFQQHGLGASFRLPSLFSLIHKFLKLDISPESIYFQVLDHELIQACLACAATDVLREIKYRARIPVPGSFTLLGVSDEWDCLEPGQVYATISDERTGLHQRILGKILITRPPQIHPGDVQFVEAVDHPALRHLTNVVVFSCR
jgi:RNA-dependent RNA polymerase